MQKAYISSFFWIASSIENFKAKTNNSKKWFYDTICNFEDSYDSRNKQN